VTIDTDARTPRRVAFVAHCLLNQTAKVGDAAYCAGVSTALIDSLRADGYRIEQMPCPELVFGGLRRWWQVREQYDTRRYRQHCRQIAGLIANMIGHWIAQGYEVAVIGVEGSPSMGVYVTSSDPTRGGRPEPSEEYSDLVEGSGILIEELQLVLAERKLRVRLAAETHDLPGSRPPGELSGPQTPLLLPRHRAERQTRTADDSEHNSRS
jgi:predicted secreted protein